MKILILCAILGTMAHCKPGGYYRQEYQFKKSSSTFKNNELQTKDDDQGFYHKQGDPNGPADVQQHNEQSQYVSPSLGGLGQTMTSYDNRDLTNEAESAFANHGLGYARTNSGMGGMNMGAGGGRSYSSYSSYSSYGTTSSNGQMSQANMQQLKQNLQQELTECLQQAMSQYRKEAARSSYVTSDSSRIHLLESEFKSNLTRFLQNALYKNHGSNLQPGAITYTVTATGVYNPQNDINQDLTDIRNQLEQQFLTELRKQVQTIRSESLSSHSQTNRRYESAGQTYYDSAEIEDLNRRPNRYAANNNMQRRDHSLIYGSSQSYGDQQSTERITYASALNSGRANRPNYNTHTSSTPYEMQVTINPNVRITDVMQNIQNNVHRQIMEALRTFEQKYTTSSYRLTNSRPTYEAALNDFKEQLRYNLTDQIQRELEKNYGVQTKMQGYSFSLNAGNTANYKLEDFENLKRTMENNLNTYLENTLRQQETRYQQQVTTTNVQNRDYTHHGPQFTKSLTETSQSNNLRYQPNVYVPSSQSQTSYGSNYQTTSQTHNNVELEDMTRRLQRELSRQLQSAIEQQRRAHTSNYQTQNSQVLYQELENELRQNITRQLQESLNKNYGNQGSRGGYSYTITSGVYNPQANYQNQDLDTMMKQMQADLEKQLREQMSSSGYRQGNYVVVSGGPYVVPSNGDSGLYASSSYPVKTQSSPTKSFNKYQQFSSYSHAATDMNGEDCSQNGGHDHGYHQRIRRHAGGYYHGFEQHQHQLQQQQHYQQMHGPQPYFSPNSFKPYYHQENPAYYSHYPTRYDSQHQTHNGQENEELGQQLEDLDNLEQQPETLDDSHFSQPAQVSHYSNSYRSHHTYHSPKHDLENLGQHPASHSRQPAYFSHQTHRGQTTQLEDLAQQPEKPRFSQPHYSSSYSSQHRAHNSHGSEELGQQLEDLDNLGQQQEDLDNLGQQLEELGQQIEDLGELTQQPQSEDYFDLVPDTSRKPNEQLIMTLPKREQVKPQNSPLTTKPQRPQNQGNNFGEDDLENLGQQLEELGQQTEDFEGQSQQGEDYFELVTKKPQPQSHVVIKPIYTRPQSTTKPTSLTKPDYEFAEVGQQLGDERQLEDQNVEKLQTGRPQSTNFNSGNRKPSAPKQDEEELGQQLEELGQQLEDLENLGQQQENFGGLGEDYFELVPEKPKPASASVIKPMYTRPQYTQKPSSLTKPDDEFAEIGQQLEDGGQEIEDLGQQLEEFDNQNVDSGFEKLQTGKPQSANFNSGNPKPSASKQDEEFGQQLEELGQQLEDLANLGQELEDLDGLSQQTEDHYGNFETGYHVPQQSQEGFGKLETMNQHAGSAYVRSTTNKPKIIAGQNDEDFQHIEDIIADVNKPAYVPYRGLNLPRPTTKNPITSQQDQQQNYDDFQSIDDIFSNIYKPEDSYNSRKPNDYNWSHTYVPYRALNTSRPTPKPIQYRPSYVPYSELSLDKSSTTPKTIASSNLYHPDDDTQQVTQDIFGHAKPLSTTDDFEDHGDYLRYVGDRKDITHMESMDRINQQVRPPGSFNQISQQQQGVYEPPRRAISLAEANSMYISRNQDAHSSRDFNFARNEPFQHTNLAPHRGDIPQQSDDLGQELEDLDLTQQSEPFGEHQQSEDFDQLTQQSEDLTQQLEDLTQQTEDLNAGYQHAKVGYEPSRPLHTATINHPPRTELHSGYGRSLDSQPPSSYGRSFSQQHSMPNGEASSYGRSSVSPKIPQEETTTAEDVEVEPVTTERVGFWKSFGGKVSSSFGSVKQKAKDLMG